MNIAIIGYGKMGRVVEKAATGQGHTVCLIVDVGNTGDLEPGKLGKADAAIEFTTPSTAAGNIIRCFEANVPVVSGTTGWGDRLEEIACLCREKNQALFHASNFSIGVNILFDLNRRLAMLMEAHGGYDVTIEDVHHIHKADAPSGTALTLAKGITGNLSRKKSWTPAPSTDGEQLQISSLRTSEVPGIHTVTWHSQNDTIELRHTAHGREGFAAGAVAAAEWLAGKKGIFGMEDMLKG